MISSLLRSGTLSAMILLTGAGLFTPLTVLAKKQTTVAGAFETNVSADWREDSGSLYSAFRSNGPHYWNWIKKESSTALFKPEGIVTGDPHVMNLADIRLQDGSLGFGLVDVDDAGLGSLLADYLRFYIGNKISPYQVKGKQLFAAYVQGLHGESIEKPAYWSQIESVTPEQVVADQEKYIQKLLKKDGFTFKNDSGVNPMPSATPRIQQLFADAENDFNRELQGYDILNVGFKIKEGGGSQDLPRYVYLLKKDNRMHIWEFKLEAAAAVSLYTQQPGNADSRMDNIEKIYRPSVPVMGPFKMIQTGNEIFLLREKLEKYTRFSQEKNETPIEVREAQEMSEYIANQMGRWQVQQAEGKAMLKLVEQDSESVFEAIKDLSKQYIQLMEQQHGKK